VIVSGVDVVDVCCAHVACRVVPPVVPIYYLPIGRWRGGGWVEAGAFVFCFCENLFPDFVPVCWQALASVGCSPWHVCRVPGGVWVVGWLEGGEGPGFAGWFLVGVGFWGWGVWWVEVFGWWGLVLGWWGCDVWGLVPLRPLLKSRPHLLGVLWFLVRAVPLLGGGVCLLVGFCGLRFFSGGVGWSCGWFVLRVVFWLGCSQPGVVVAVLVGCLGSVVCLLGLLCGCGLCGLCSVSGGCSQACCVVPVGWADLDGRALRRPPLSPPTVHDRASQTPEPGGRTHTLKR